MLIPSVLVDFKSSEQTSKPLKADSPAHRSRGTMTQEADFGYIMTTVLGQKADSPIRKSLSRAGIDDVAGIMSLAKQRIENLKYKDSAAGKAILTEFPDGYLQHLICFKAYIGMKLKAGKMVV